MARVCMLLVAMVLVSCSVASAARVLQEQGADVYQEEKFKHHGHHDHGKGKPKLPSLPKPKLPSFPKPKLPTFKLPGCPPPPDSKDTPGYDSPPYSYTPSPPSSPTYSSPTWESPPPPAGGY